MRTFIARAATAALLTAVLVAPAGAVVGGQPAPDSQFGNVAILRFVDSDGTYPTDRWRCTGTLVAPDVIITAAHCTDPPADTVCYAFTEQGPLGESDAKPGGTSSPTPSGTATFRSRTSTTSGSSSSTSR
jgi:hypothetical protein